MKVGLLLVNLLWENFDGEPHCIMSLSPAVGHRIKPRAIFSTGPRCRHTNTKSAQETSGWIGIRCRRLRAIMRCPVPAANLNQLGIRFSKFNILLHFYAVGRCFNPKRFTVHSKHTAVKKCRDRSEIIFWSYYLYMSLSKIIILV